MRRPLPKLLAMLMMLFLITSATAAPANYLSEALRAHRGAVWRWNDQTRVINVAIYPGSGVPHWKPEMTAQIQAAFSEWERAFGGKIHFAYTTDPRVTDVKIQWVARDQGDRVGHQTFGEGTDARTFITPDITIAVNDAKGQAHTPSKIKYIALHEIGHMLGLQGHSPDPNDIMYYQVNPQIAQKSPAQIRLSARDITTLKLLYQQPPTVSNPLGIHMMEYKQYKYYARLGNTAFQSKNYSDALRYYQQAEKIYPQSPIIYFNAGAAAFNLKKFPQATHYFEKDLAMRKTPDSQYYLAYSLKMLAMQDLNKGNRQLGKQKLAQAQTLFQSVVSNPASSVPQKQTAKQELSLLKKHLPRI